MEEQVFDYIVCNAAGVILRHGRSTQHDGHTAITGELCFECKAQSFDPLSQCVDVAATNAALAAWQAKPYTEYESPPDGHIGQLPLPRPQPVLIDYQPPQPINTAVETWSWDVTSKRWLGTPTLLAQQTAQWELVKAARDAAVAAGFTWNGHVFDSDEVSQQRIQGAVQLASLAAAANQTFSIGWTLQDNTVLQMTGADVINMGLALGTFVQTNFAKGVALRATIDATTDASQLGAIVWA